LRREVGVYRLHYMANNGFKGIPGVSSILTSRYDEDVDKIYDRMGEVVDSCRRYLMNLYQKERDKELNDNYIKNELMSHLLKESPGLSVDSRDKIAEQILNELRGLGPVQEILKDPEVTDVVIVDYSRILYEKNGRVYVLDKNFRDEGSLRSFIDKLCYLGRGRVDESRPYTSLTIPAEPNSYRAAIQIPPMMSSATVSIRKFTTMTGMDGLVKNGTYSKEAASFLKKAVKGRANIFFSGPMGTGKTTQIAVLGEYFDADEMPVLVEEVRECPLEHPNLRKMVGRPANIEGKGKLGIGDMLVTALQMRASRILVAEVRDGAAFHMLQAMNVGHFGSMGTGHANSPHDLIFHRLPNMLRMAKETRNMGEDALVSYICSALHIVIQLGWEKDKRVCTRISEVTQDPPGTRNIFIRKNGKLKPCGYYPERVAEILAVHKVKL